MTEVHLTKTVIATDSMSTLQKIDKKMLYTDWIDLIYAGHIEKLNWIFCPGHLGVIGNERADTLAGQAQIGGEFTLRTPLLYLLMRQTILVAEK